MKLIKLEQINCAPCTQVSKYLDERNVQYKKVNVWDYPDIAAQFEVLSVPVTILLDDQDNVLAKSVGFKPSELENIISQIQ